MSPSLNSLMEVWGKVMVILINLLVVTRPAFALTSDVTSTTEDTTTSTSYVPGPSEWSLGALLK